MRLTLRKLFSPKSASPGGSAAGQLEHAQTLIEEGQLEPALATLQQLVAAEPGHAEAWYKQGNVLKDLGRPLEALGRYDRAIALKPQYTAALSNRGVVLLRLDRAQEALDAFQRAIDTDPNDAVVRYNCASAQVALNQQDAGMAGYSKAIELRPGYAEAYFGRARLYEESRQWQEALNDYDRSLALGLNISATHFHRGNVLAGFKRWDDAVVSYDLALMLDPDNVPAHLHRANVLRQLQRWEDALTGYERASLINPNDIHAHFNRGVLLEQLGRLPEAISSFDSAVAIQPDFVQAQHNRALALLLSGNWLDGFRDYQWRWKNRQQSVAAEDYRGATPLWSGQESLDGKTILIFSEQGLGDTLQFCRYVRMVAGLGAKVVFEVQEPLVRLLAGIEGASQVVSRESAIPHCDYKVPLLSLPLAFKTTLDTVPDGRKYLHIDEQLIRSWETRLGARKRPRIGLVWSGSATFVNDHFRSMSLAQLAGRLPRNFEYFCLQKDIRESDRAFLEANSQIIDHATDFMDTAALCECMDLVISVCTSIAHLAGALGRPLWILLAFNADWRWLKDREDSPWYPTATLYRQPSIGDWDSVIAKVAEDLQEKFGPDSR
jgi:tetratricopeptide (TPR) repeat protein